MYYAKEFDFDIPYLIQKDIDELLEYLNNGGEFPDCHMDNLRSDINSYDIDLTREQQEALKDYYCRGGIYVTKNPEPNIEQDDDISDSMDDFDIGDDR